MLQVISVMPDMAEVYNVIIKMKKSQPGTALLEVIGPVFCNTTRHFLLIQVWSPLSCEEINCSLQGRWSLDVERAWLALFGELAAMIRESYNSHLTEPSGTS